MSTDTLTPRHQAYGDRMDARTPKTSGHWMAIDWAMKAITLAAHSCELAGLEMLSLRLLEIHEEARKERDRA